MELQLRKLHQIHMQEKEQIENEEVLDRRQVAFRCEVMVEQRLLGLQHSLQLLEEDFLQ